MKNYKIYIIGAVMLGAGVAIGWLMKPAEVHEAEHSHSETSMSSEQTFTCSMHPQIRQNEPGICPICEMDLTPLDQSMSNDDPTILKMSKEAVKLAQIQTTVVGESLANEDNGKNKREAEVDGTVELDERTLKSQSVHLPGRIETMAVTFEGQYVSAGQKIATIYSEELLSASQELITAFQYENRIDGIVEASKQKLRNWKISEEQIQDIVSKGEAISTISIYADHSGYVLDKLTSQGDYVKAGKPLYNVGSMNQLWLIFNVFESDLAYVRKGDQVTFTTPSVPQKTFSAKITYIEPLLNSKTRTAVVRAEMRNPGQKLKPGMLLDGKISSTKNISSGKSSAEIMIPNSAVLWTGERSVVYVQVEDVEVPSFEFREVEIGANYGDMVEISAGLEGGERIVTEGAFSVDAAAQLNNNFSMMNRDVQVKKDMKGNQVPDFSAEVDVKFVEQLDHVVLKYLGLKNALVASDNEQATEAIVEVEKAISEVEMGLVKGDAHIFWMEQQKALQSHAEMIKNSGELEVQRDQFEFLSMALINALKAFGTNEETYFVQHCPMAKDNQGADWISEEKQIRNPYFGDKMMKCGVVKVELN